MKFWHWLGLLPIIGIIFCWYFTPIWPYAVRKAIDKDRAQCISIINNIIETNYKDFLQPEAIPTELKSMTEKFDHLWPAKDNKDFYCAVATDNDDASVVGVVFAHINSENSVAQDFLYVHPAYQKQSIGKALHYAMINHFMLHEKKPTKVQSIAHRNNKSAQRFHEKYGFKQTGVLEAEDQPHSMVIMEKSFV